MRAGWFTKQGYVKTDRSGISVLLWKKFSEDAVPPRWIRAKKKPNLFSGKVVVTALVHGWCSGVDGMAERAKRVCAEFGDRVIYREIDTGNRDVVRQWGVADALFVDAKNIYQEPPLTADALKKAIAKKVRALRV